VLNLLLVLAQEAAEAPRWGIFRSEPGTVPAFIFTLIFVAFIYIMIQRARAGLVIPEIRKLPGLDAIDEAIGRATEMGRPVHYSPGISNLETAQTIASFPMLSYVAKTCARYDTKFIQTNRQYSVHPVCEEIIRQAYLEAGRPDAFNPDDVRYLSGDQWAYTAGVLGIIQREKPAANIMFGSFYAETMILLEAGAWVGAVQIGATANVAQLPFFVAAADYTLIGEEMYAASAYLSKEPVLRGTVVGQDWAKILVFLVIIAGTIIAQTRPEINPLADWLKNF